jgi:hypothetical protein
MVSLKKVRQLRQEYHGREHDKARGCQVDAMSYDGSIEWSEQSGDGSANRKARRLGSD